ncbi:hypothetical protein FA15DRAFT_655388 [Coprinopsis marcescibilis]|uniref:Uncharacterized protein n=1 Tax=Coprinopsis marcescibilis TaxID=230819 RepID=A0A5C3KXW5_COPMA|nr:hypothetical protein FA15DRAFT_655388 [Coprinopsis marcescibilis]
MYNRSGVYDQDFGDIRNSSLRTKRSSTAGSTRAHSRPFIHQANRDSTSSRGNSLSSNAHRSRALSYSSVQPAHFGNNYNGSNASFPRGDGYVANDPYDPSNKKGGVSKGTTFDDIRIDISQSNYPQLAAIEEEDTVTERSDSIYYPPPDPVHDDWNDSPSGPPEPIYISITAPNHHHRPSNTISRHASAPNLGDSRLYTGRSPLDLYPAELPSPNRDATTVTPTSDHLRPTSPHRQLSRITELTEQFSESRLSLQSTRSSLHYQQYQHDPVEQGTHQMPRASSYDNLSDGSTGPLNWSVQQSQPWRSVGWVVRYVAVGIPKEAYNLVLLRLPSLYFSRVARIFEEADLSLSEIKKMALKTASRSKATHLTPFHLETEEIPPVYASLKNTWESFIDSLMREWKTFNIISVLLLSAILTILQIDSAANDAVTRYTALASLICALISLLYGCVYIIRFGTMRKTYKAAEWALEARKSHTTIFWNVWVLLAMPAVWLSWSLILYITCIMSFLWRTDTHSNEHGPMPFHWLLAIRVIISTILGLGVVYGILVLRTFRRYGTAMDNAWKGRINGWIADQDNEYDVHRMYDPHPYASTNRTGTPQVQRAPYIPPHKNRSAGSMSFSKSKQANYPRNVRYSQQLPRTFVESETVSNHYLGDRGAAGRQNMELDDNATATRRPVEDPVSRPSISPHVEKEASIARQSLSMSDLSLRSHHSISSEVSSIRVPRPGTPPPPPRPHAHVSISVLQRPPVPSELQPPRNSRPDMLPTLTPPPPPPPPPPPHHDHPVPTRSLQSPFAAQSAPSLLTPPLMAHLRDSESHLVDALAVSTSIAGHNLKTVGSDVELMGGLRQASLPESESEDSNDIDAGGLDLKGEQGPRKDFDK